jgi:ADP-ribose pyrophosphatase YjhB (NUDIX family)
MVHSAGLAIIYQNKILLVKPTDARWWKSYGIPKGHVEDGESFIDAAIREVKEEIGIEIPKFMIGEENELFYTRKEKKWKRIAYFYVLISDLSDIGLESEILPKEMLQAEEIEWAGFVPFEEARSRMIPSMLEIID